MSGINLVRNGEFTLSRQIYTEMKRRILTGGLKGGEAVPSTRELARELAVSRNTAVEAYELLVAEGFLETRPGAAATVTEGLNLGLPEEERPSDPPAAGTAAGEIDFITGRRDGRGRDRFHHRPPRPERFSQIPVE